MDVRGVQRHEDGVEVEASHRFQQNLGIVMTGDAQEPDTFIRAGLQQCFQALRPGRRSGPDPRVS